MLPTYGPTHERLATLAGNWRGEGEVFANPWGPAGRSASTWAFRFDPPRLNLIHDFHERRDGGFAFDGHGVLTVDPDGGDVLWFWFDTHGYPPLQPARGGWEGNTLRLEKHTPRGVGRSSFELGTDRLVYRVVTRLAGADAFIPITTAEYRREG